MPKGADEGMTIIRAGEEVKITEAPAATAQPKPVPDTPPAPVLPEQAADVATMERKILQALIKLLIEKGIITLDELQEKMKE